MRPEIGSDYWLTQNDYNSALLCEADVNLPIGLSNMFLTNLCRTGIELYLDSIKIKKGVVLLPEFTCHSVVYPFVHHDYDVYCYALNQDLTINIDSFVEQVRKISPNIIVLHSYFGFDTLIDNIKSISPRSIIIEDLTQRFMSSFPLIDADCFVGSIRKWFPIPDGGFFCGDVNFNLSDNYDNEFIDLEIKALLAKGEYIEGKKTDKAVFRSLFSQARNILEEKELFFSMSKISKQIYNSIDIEVWKRKRQENGRYLLNKLQDFNFLELPQKNIDKDTVPFLIPTYVKDGRKEFQTYLAKNNIYATIIWTCPNELSSQLTPIGQYIYDHILCFHCDQRYDLDDMQRIHDVINQYNNLRNE